MTTNDLNSVQKSLCQDKARVGGTKPEQGAVQDILEQDLEALKKEGTCILYGLEKYNYLRL
jgi:hypothetical protein